MAVTMAIPGKTITFAAGFRQVMGVPPVIIQISVGFSNKTIQLLGYPHGHGNLWKTSILANSGSPPGPLWSPQRGHLTTDLLGPGHADAEMWFTNGYGMLMMLTYVYYHVDPICFSLLFDRFARHMSKGNHMTSPNSWENLVSCRYFCAEMNPLKTIIPPSIYKS